MTASRRAISLHRTPDVGLLAPDPAIDRELRWFFLCHDCEDVPFTFARMPSPADDGREWLTPEEHARALHRLRVIRLRLRSISDSDAGVLQCAYEPRPWPVVVARQFGRLTGVVVRLSCDRATWPEERARQLVVDARNAEMLLGMLRAGGDAGLRTIRGLRLEAQLRFLRALGEYAAARGGRSPWRAR